MNKQQKIVWGLCILLIVAVLFIAATQIRAYNIGKQARDQEIYNQGTNDGYAAAVGQLMEQLATCQQVPLFADNVTINAVAVECLQ